MYISINLENIITIGIMLAGWMLALHLLGQAGIHVSQLWGGNS